MNIERTTRLINARIKIGTKTKLDKVVKVQIFTTKNGIANLLIGNIYYNRNTNEILEGVVETNGKCLTSKNNI